MSRYAAVWLALPALLVLPRVCGATLVCSAGSIACYDPFTYAILFESVPAPATPGHTYVASTSDLKSLPGIFNTPDTILWVVATTGEVLAVNDDYAGSLASRAEFTVQQETSYKIIVAAYTSSSVGTCDLTVVEDQQSVLSLNDELFGGTRRSYVDARQGDRLFVGVPQDGEDHTVYQNEMFWLSTSSFECSGACGTWVQAPEVAGLSLHTVAAAAPTATLLIGSALPTVSVSIRLLHARLGAGWGGGAAHQDNDGDGLTWELEALASPDPGLSINTCDTPSGPAAECPTLAAPGTYPTGWAPSDSDNDGLKDGWEVFGVRRTCTKLQLAPYYDPGTCTDITWGGAVLATTGEEPVSAFDTDPRTPDLFVSVDYDKKAPGVGNWYPMPEEIQQVEEAFGVEGMECAYIATLDTSTYCDAETLYRIHARLYPGSLVSAVDQSDHRARIMLVRSTFNSLLHPDRKVTGMFRYARLTNTLSTTGGQALGVPGRVVQLSGNQSDVAEELVHENGHTMGLRHGGFEDMNHKANYPSVMNYAYGKVVQKAAAGVDDDLMPNDFGQPCVQDSGCPISNACGPVTHTCTVNFGRFRFSRGHHVPLNEPSLSELAQPPNLCAAVHLSHALPIQFVSDAECRIDWNRSGTYEALVAADVNLDGDSTDVDVQDHNDWLRMFDKARHGLSYMRSAAFASYASNLSTLSPVDYSGWNHATSITGDVSSEPGPGGYYGNALRFPGVCAGSGCQAGAAIVGASVSTRTMGDVVDVDVAPTPIGFIVDVMFRLTSYEPAASGHQLVYSELFQIDIPNTGPDEHRVRAWLSTWPGLPLAKVVHDQTEILTGQWYRVRLSWQAYPNGSSPPGRVKIVLAKYVGSGFDLVNATCTSQDVAWVSPVDPGAITLGSYRPNPAQWALHGELDEPWLTTGIDFTARYFDGSYKDVYCLGAGGKANDYY